MRIMICPESKTCKRGYEGIGEHCDEHLHKPSCNFCGDACPACVPVAATHAEIAKRISSVVRAEGGWK